VFTATVIVVVCSLGTFATLMLLRGEGELPFSVIEIVCGVTIVAIFVASYIVMQKLESWLRRREVERYRCDLGLKAHVSF
jgi:hypothetical protein